MNLKPSVIFLLLLHTAAFASPLNCEPFAPTDQPPTVSLRQLEPKTEPDKTVSFQDPTVDKTEIRLSSAGSGEPLFVELLAAGRVQFPKAKMCPDGMLSCADLYSSDLNQDGRPDYVVVVSTGGVGLNADCSFVTFLLSAGPSFTLTTTTAYNFGSNDVILVSGKPRFVFASMSQVEKCKDGKEHSFWVYNLLSFDKGTMKVDNSQSQDFPKVIWYTDAPNHKETTLLDIKQKAKLIKDAQASWREKLD